MTKTVKIKTPAKVNLTLEIVNRRPDGFHNIKSVMQMIDLYDYLTITLEPSEKREITLSGTSDEIPYNEKNLVWRACSLFLDSTGLSGKISVHIEKNIPVSAGLAGGSTNASGTIFGLNRLFATPLNNDELHKLCATLGSDLNVCLEGGCLLATSRGEVIEKLPFQPNKISLIKPINLGISAKEAYTKYSQLLEKPNRNSTEKMVEALKANSDISEFLYNDLETAVFDDYPILQQIKSDYPSSIMSGSGSTYFCLNSDFSEQDGFWVSNGHNFIPDGVSVC